MKTRYEPVKAKPAKRWHETKKLRPHETVVTRAWAQQVKPKGPTPSVKKRKIS